jgi:CubicO group peptidase (beta-lactamase class C family)
LQALIDDAVRRKRAPKIVLAVARKGKVVFRGTAGEVAPDAIFDLASVTKPVATATAIMQLFERGRLRLRAPIGRYLPRMGKKRLATVRQLLLHTAGLKDLVRIGPELRGAVTLSNQHRKLARAIIRSKPRGRPGQRYLYSDAGYILLGMLVEKLSGKTLAQWAHEQIFAPLGMCDSGFRPRGAQKKRALSAWPGGGNLGVSYDNNVPRLGGVAGHAGLFASADDLLLYGQMLLAGGRLRGKQILEAKTVRLMTRIQYVPRAYRALGWRADRWAPRSQRAYLSRRAFGHTGYTGTALWIDPENQLVIALLTNRTRDKGNVVRLRRKVMQTVAASLKKRRPRRTTSGLSSLSKAVSSELRGKRVLWVSDRRTLPSQLTALGVLATTADKAERVLVDYRLAGAGDQASLQRLWTAVQAAQRSNLPMLVFDRDNPLGGLIVEGPPFRIAELTVSARHGLTSAEWVLLFTRLLAARPRSRPKGPRLQIVKLKNWRRRAQYDRDFAGQRRDALLKLALAPFAACVDPQRNELFAPKEAVALALLWRRLGAVAHLSLLASHCRRGAHCRRGRFVPSGELASATRIAFALERVLKRLRRPKDEAIAKCRALKLHRVFRRHRKLTRRFRRLRRRVLLYR